VTRLFHEFTLTNKSDRINGYRVRVRVWLGHICFAVRGEGSGLGICPNPEYSPRISCGRSKPSAFIYASSHADAIVMMIVDNKLIGLII